MKNQTLTCQVRYRLDTSRITEFKAYARLWTALVERYGGTHHGYFLPASVPEGAQISFSAIGRDGPADIAVALFSFPDVETYLRYREAAEQDPDCHAATALYESSHCFLSYERLFLQPLT